MDGRTRFPPGAAFVVDDERHHIVAQAFLKQNESTNPAISVLEGEDFLKADVEVQDMVALDLRLVVIACNPLSQAGTDKITACFSLFAMVYCTRADALRSVYP